jgi:hypothetical protein
VRARRRCALRRAARTRRSTSRPSSVISTLSRLNCGDEAQGRASGTRAEQREPSEPAARAHGGAKRRACLVEDDRRYSARLALPRGRQAAAGVPRLRLQHQRVARVRRGSGCSPCGSENSAAQRQALRTPPAPAVALQEWTVRWGGACLGRTAPRRRAAGAPTAAAAARRRRRRRHRSARRRQAAGTRRRRRGACCACAQPAATCADAAIGERAARWADDTCVALCPSDEGRAHWAAHKPACVRAPLAAE